MRKSELYWWTLKGIKKNSLWIREKGKEEEGRIPVDLFLLWSAHAHLVWWPGTPNLWWQLKHVVGSHKAFDFFFFLTQNVLKSGLPYILYLSKWRQFWHNCFDRKNCFPNTQIEKNQKGNCTRTCAHTQKLKTLIISPKDDNHSWHFYCIFFQVF